MIHETLIRLEVPAAWDARLAGLFAVLIQLVAGVDRARRFELFFAMTARKVHPSLWCLYLECPVSREVVDCRWKAGLSLYRLTNDGTSIGLTV